VSGAIERNKPIEVILTAEQWQSVLNVLGQGPYNVVAQLIENIGRQCMSHAEQRAPERVQ